MLSYSSEKMKQVYARIVFVILMVIGLTFLMWLINIFEFKKFNFLFFVGGTAYIVLALSYPHTLLKVAFVGAGVEALRDNDISQGAVKGLVVLYRISLGILLFYMTVAGVLSTMSFAAAPMNFFEICAMLLLLQVVVAFFNIKGSILKWFIIAYAMGVIVISLYGLFPEQGLIHKWGGVIEKSITPDGSKSAAPSTDIPLEESLKIVKEGKWQTIVVIWDKLNSDGTIPMNTPSPVVKIGRGCSTLYSDRENIDYRVLNQVIGGGWEPHIRGKMTLGNEVKFEVIKEGVKEVTYELSCP